MGLNHAFQKDTLGAIEIRDFHLGALLEVPPSGCINITLI